MRLFKIMRLIRSYMRLLTSLYSNTVCLMQWKVYEFAVNIIFQIAPLESML